MKPVRTVAPFLALALLLTASCSNDKNDDAKDKKDAKSALTTAPKTPGKGTPFCREVKKLDDLDKIVGEFNPNNPAELAKGLSVALTELDVLHESAPDSLKADIDVLSNLIKKMGTAFSSIDPKHPEEGLQTLITFRDDIQKGQVATDHLAAYAKSNCGVELNRGTTTSIKPGSTTTTAPGSTTTTAPGASATTTTSTEPPK